MSGQVVPEKSSMGEPGNSKNELCIQTSLPSSVNSKPGNVEHQNSVNSEPCSPQPMSPDQVHDLPPELLQAGWRKFWSRREGRPYYFNKLTNESLWETPTLGILVSLAMFSSFIQVITYKAK